MHRHVPSRDYADRSSKKRCFQLRGPLRHDRLASIFHQSRPLERIVWWRGGGSFREDRRVISSVGPTALDFESCYPRGIDRSIPPITLNGDSRSQICENERVSNVSTIDNRLLWKLLREREREMVRIFFFLRPMSQYSSLIVIGLRVVVSGRCYPIVKLNYDRFHNCKV